MDGSQNIYNYYIEKAQISFLNTCNKFYNPVYNVNKILARDLNIGSDFVIGLRFCIQNKGGCLLTRDGIMLFKNLTYTPVQTVTLPTVYRKLNTNKTRLLPEPCCDNCQNNQCQNSNLSKENKNIKENLEEVRNYTLFNAEGQECLTDIEKDYTLISIETQFYNFRKGIG